MGTGFSADTPIRVAHLGITSVISLTDDLLLEKIRKYYAKRFNLPYIKIPKNEEDGRAKRTTAYLDTVMEIVQMKMDAVRKQPFFESNDKKRFFDLLPEESPLKSKYNTLLSMAAGPERDALAKDLTQQMKPGSIDTNIMVRLDRVNYDHNGNPMGDEFTDAKASLRGFANSGLQSSIVFSAGINQRLFSYMTHFRDFYRDPSGKLKKRIILKVSDFRSALIQGKFLAKKGLEVYEFRIESGLNCGGHAFASNGILLPSLLKEFKEKREELTAAFRPMILKYYMKMGWKYPESALNERPLITVQGGIGSNGEVNRLRRDFNIDLTGWASPFLLVPETTSLDATTRELLRKAEEDDLYMSDASPLGIPFNNVRNSGSEIWTKNKTAGGNPGSTCPKGYLVSTTEYTEKPICSASRKYQTKKLSEISKLDLSIEEKEKRLRSLSKKVCLCGHLASGALIDLKIVKEKNAPQAVCPGPNIAWFNKTYTLQEMVDHIYGRGPSLVPPERPHMFANEIVMYVDFFDKIIKNCTYTSKEISPLYEFVKNLEEGMDLCLKIAQKSPYPGENLASIPPCVEKQRARLKSICIDFENERSLRNSHGEKALLAHS